MKKLIMLILLILLTGCFGKVEIDELPIVSALGVDKCEEGFKVSTQVIRPKVVGRVQQGIQGANVFMFTTNGESVNEALRKMSVYYKNKVFLGHMQLLVFGEDYAKEGVKDAIEYFFESPLTRQRFLIAIVKEGKAEDLLKIQTPMLDTPATEINASIENNAKYYGNSVITYADEVYASSLSREFNVAITGLKVEGDPEEGSDNKNLESIDIKAKIKVSGVGLFRDDKLIGWLDDEETIGYNRIRGLLKSTVHTVYLDEEDITSIETNSAKIKREIKIIDDIPEITINYKVTGVVPSVSTNKFLEKEEISHLEEQTVKIIKETMEKALSKIKEYKIDAFFLGEIINDKFPKYWEKVKDNFSEIIPHIKMNFNVTVTIVNQSN